MPKGTFGTSFCNFEMMGSDWINVHTHKPGKGISVVDSCLGMPPFPENGRIYHSLGIHPMDVDEDAENRLEAIRKAAAEKKIVAVGEAGLDRNVPVAMEVQMAVFQRQAEIASAFGLPLIVHGVRAISEIIAVYNRCQAPRNWIIHGFNNRKEVLADLLRHDFYISAGRQVMNRESNIYRLLPEIPDERLFIETDNSDFAIEEVYRAVAGRKNVSVEQLRHTVKLNFERVFHLVV